MYYVGLDIHQRSTSMEILDCNGKLVKRGDQTRKVEHFGTQWNIEEGIASMNEGKYSNQQCGLVSKHRQ